MFSSESIKRNSLPTESAIRVTAARSMLRPNFEQRVFIHPNSSRCLSGENFSTCPSLEIVDTNLLEGNDSLSISNKLAVGGKSVNRSGKLSHSAKSYFKPADLLSTPLNLLSKPSTMTNRLSAINGTVVNDVNSSSTVTTFPSNMVVLISDISGGVTVRRNSDTRSESLNSSFPSKMTINFSPQW